jgi:hypothetical protein
MCLASIGRKDFHDQLSCSDRHDCRQGQGQDGLSLIGYLYGCGGYLHAVPARKCSRSFSVQTYRHRLSGIGTSRGLFNSKRDRADLVLLRAGQGRHVERAPVAIIIMDETSSASAVAGARVVQQNPLVSGLREHGRTGGSGGGCWGWCRGRGGGRPHRKPEGDGDDQCCQSQACAGPVQSRSDALQLRGELVLLVCCHGPCSLCGFGIADLMAGCGRILSKFAATLYRRNHDCR